MILLYCCCCCTHICTNRMRIFNNFNLHLKFYIKRIQKVEKDRRLLTFLPFLKAVHIFESLVHFYLSCYIRLLGYTVPIHLIDREVTTRYLPRFKHIKCVWLEEKPSAERETDPKLETRSSNILTDIKSDLHSKHLPKQLR